MHLFQQQLHNCIIHEIPQLINSGQSKKAIALVFISKLISLGIKWIAADFDKTIIRLHSGGVINPWCDQNDVLHSLSDDFNIFATLANQHGIRIAVVTFSDELNTMGADHLLAGPALVQEVLKQSEANFNVEKIYGFFPFNWSTKEQWELLGLNEPMPNNKGYHLKKMSQDWNITPESILLIDDDLTNCRAARQEDYLVLAVVNGEGFAFDSISAQF